MIRECHAMPDEFCPVCGGPMYDVMGDDVCLNCDAEYIAEECDEEAEGE